MSELVAKQGRSCGPASAEMWAEMKLFDNTGIPREQFTEAWNAKRLEESKTHDSKNDEESRSCMILKR